MHLNVHYPPLSIALTVHHLSAIAGARSVLREGESILLICVAKVFADVKTKHLLSFS